jgi:hypothetical protein
MIFVLTRVSFPNVMNGSSSTFTSTFLRIYTIWIEGSGWRRKVNQVDSPHSVSFSIARASSPASTSPHVDSVSGFSPSASGT